MKERIIKRLWHGVASLRDYEIKKFIKDGGIKLVREDNQETMTLSPEDLTDKNFQLTKTPQQSINNKGQTYTLIDFAWKSDKKESKLQRNLNL